MTQTQKAVVIGMANNSLSVTKTAREMHYHHNTIQFHVQMIHKQTGLNPRNFFDMIQLYQEATGGGSDES